MAEFAGKGLLGLVAKWKHKCIKERSYRVSQARSGPPGPVVVLCASCRVARASAPDHLLFPPAVPIAFRDGGALSFRARADRQRMDAEGEAGTANSNTNIGTSSTATRAAPPSPTFVARPVGPSRGAEYDFDSGRPGGDSGDGNEGVARECAVLDGALSWGEPPARTAPPEVKLRQVTGHASSFTKMQCCCCYAWLCSAPGLALAT